MKFKIFILEHQDGSLFGIYQRENFSLKVK